MPKGIYPRPSLEERFWNKVELMPNGCCEWKGAKNQCGYGYFWEGGRYVRIHRLVYELEYGKIPKGMIIDHLCRNHSCVNPTHLEVVTYKENIDRGLTGADNAIKTHCPQGHEYSEENTRVDKNGSRHCKICDRE